MTEANTEAAGFETEAKAVASETEAKAKAVYLETEAQGSWSIYSKLLELVTSNSVRGFVLPLLY